MVTHINLIKILIYNYELHPNTFFPLSILKNHGCYLELMHLLCPKRTAETDAQGKQLVSPSVGNDADDDDDDNDARRAR